MALSVSEFWKLLVQSQLLTQEQCQHLSVGFAETPGAATAPGKKLAEWLVKKNVLSKYQAIILLARRTGPFFYGDYKIYDRLDSGRLAGSFRGVHAATNHPVLLKFVAAGSAAQTPQGWGELQAWIPATAHPNLVRCYEAVDLGTYKFVVLEDLRGQTIAELLEKSPRIPCDEASRLARLAAGGLSHLHDSGRVHGDVRPQNLWLEPNGNLKLLLDPETGTRTFSLLTAANEPDGLERADYAAPEFLQPGRPADPLVDTYALGCSLYQMVAGQPPFAGGDVHAKLHRHATEAIQPLDAIGAPPPFTHLVAYAMAKNPAVRFQQVRMLADQLGVFVGASQQNFRPTQPPVTQTPFELALQQRQAMASRPRVPVGPIGVAPSQPIAGPDPPVVPGPLVTGPLVTTPIMPTVPLPPAPNWPGAPPAPAAALVAGALPTANKSSDVAVTIRRRAKAKQRNDLLFLAFSLLAVGGAIGTVLYVMNAAPVEVGDEKPEKSSSSGGEGIDIAPPGSGPPSVAVNTTAPTPANGVDGDGHVGSIATGPASANVVADDGQTLWMSPTSGAPLSFKYVPPGAQLFLVVRPAALLSDAEGARVWKALGPRFEASCKAWEGAAGVALADVEQLVVALYANQGRPPKPAYVVRLKTEVAAADLQAKWTGAAAVEGVADMMQKGDTAYYTPPDDRRTFVMGPFDPEMREAASLGWKPPLLRRELGQLLQISDDQRHLTILFAPNFLFGDGQELFAGDLSRAMRPLEWFLGTGLKAGMISAHLDSNFYFEMRMESDIQVDRYQLASMIRERMAEIPGSVESYIAALNPHPYWRLVAFRYPAMIRFLHQHTRIGVDGSHAMLNSILPGQAAHNLVFGGEMVIASAPGAEMVASASAKPAAPQSLDDLLKAKISVGFAQDSLEFAIQNVVTEAKAAYPELPFEFQIKILGSDLEKDGITRNQQVRDFNQQDKTVAEILTAMVMKANPIKTVKAPNEADQKLIWVVAANPDNPAQQAVLVTTRAAAAQKNYLLPEVFRLQ